MKNIIKFLLSGYIIFLCCKMTSCSDMDDYLKYLDNGIPTYTGIVDRATFHSGDERVVFSGLLTSDPKIRKVMIYWNNRKDSLLLDINRTSGVDTLFQPIPLPEGRYNFEVISYDDKGIPSITVSKAGISYGEEYKSGLYNRPIKSLEKVGVDAVIKWYNGDESSPFVKIDYEDTDGQIHTVKAVNKDDTTVLKNYKSMSLVRLQAYYLPDTIAIDTFKAKVDELVALENITRQYIVNPGNPFLRGDDGDGKWGTLKGWQYTSNVLNQNGNTAGGWSTDANGTIHLESRDWGGDGFTNGKIYQTITLSAGKYSLEYYSDGFGGSATSMFAVALGNTLPDLEDIEGNTLAHKISKDGVVTGNHTINFQLDKEEIITFGWTVTIPGSNTWYHINWVKLMVLGL
ncbi:DUF4998 domain-containing protein [Prevotella sp. 10(H)]|uniref:DUF4998 domain-containing protein n=1 Tax=Prevotella sp. 10(H) TaxID=1158294 RepID=UPI0004A77AD1|nr:DUF4998 domain-containing protein [Prevotella sp. 10(H)]